MFDKQFMKDIVTLNLEKLDLSSCSHLKNYNIELLTLNSSLKELSLSLLNITEIAMKNIVHLQLTNLDISKCKYITDPAIDIISKIHSLIKLNVSGCDISNRSIISIRQLKMLRELNISYCKDITPKGFKQLFHMSSLKKIYAISCSKLPQKYLSTIESNGVEIYY